MPDPVADYLRTLNTSDRARAAAWDAVYASKDDADREARLRQLPFSDAVRATLWDLASGGTAPSGTTPKPEAAEAHTPQTSALADIAGGLRSSAARTVFGGGDLLRRGWNAVVPESMETERVINRPAVQAGMKAPESFAGQAASFVGDTAQFFLPTGVVGKGAKAAEVAKAMALTGAQTGSLTDAGISGAITAAIPTAGALARASKSLRQGAEKNITQALGATKEGMKAKAAELAPEMLRRGVRGSRDAMLEQAKAMTTKVGAAIGQEIDDAARAGESISALSLRKALSEAKDSIMIPAGSGGAVPIEGAQGVARRLDRLARFVDDIAVDGYIPIDRAAKVKTAWDRIVNKAGLYGNKATASATDNEKAWAIREGASAFRDLLSKSSTTLDDLNKEYAFWKGLRTVLSETQRRTQAQASVGLGAQTQGAAPGAMIAGAVGSIFGPGGAAAGAGIGALAGPRIVAAMQSPWWRTTAAAPVKQKLADALASGSAERINSAVGRIVAALPSSTSDQ